LHLRRANRILKLVKAALEKPLGLRPILITDDDADDAYLLQLRLRKAGVPNPILVFRDGEELLRYFAKANPWPEAKPFVLLLDLKMPLVDGFDVLAAVRTEARLRALPVVAITSSTRAEDRDRAIVAGADEFFEKFPSEAELAAVIDRASRHPFFAE
jgi:CheY-like chemotaxis protein